MHVGTFVTYGQMATNMLLMFSGVARFFQQGAKARERSDRARVGVGGGCPPPTV